MLLTAGFGMSVTPAASAMPGPSAFSTGFVDDTTFEAVDPNLRSLWLGRARALGAGWVRLTVPWFVVAPYQLPPRFDAASASDPNYHWSWLDDVVRDATSHHLRVLLMINQPPTWAYGRNPPSAALAPAWRPNIGALGAFAHALAQRYSGRFPDPLNPGRHLPRISYFQAWNEPNLRVALMPQWTRSHRHWVPASPAYYRRMLNAVYANVKAVQPRAYILAAGLAPYGDPPGVDRMPPVVFLRELLCLAGKRLRRERCRDPAHFNAIDIHPYALTPTIHARNANDVSVPDLGKLSRVLSVARRFHRALPGGRKPIWVTEIDWTSRPPDPYGIPIGRQTRFVALAFYEFWRQGVKNMFWFLIRDLAYKSLAGAGVYFSSGAAKPSARAFEFPFVALPQDHHVMILWGRAPRRGIVTIQRLRRHRWRNLLRLRTTRGGVFYARRGLGSHLILRAVAARVASAPWSTGRVTSR